MAFRMFRRLILALSIVFVGLPVIATLSSNAQAEEPEKKEEKKGGTLCTDYTSCNACIAGLQADKAMSQGEAETSCSLAAAGCWATWEKPVVCGDKKDKKDKKKEETKAE